MKNKGRNSRIKLAINHFGLYLLMISTILWIAYEIMQYTLEQNVKNRAFDELKAKVKMQVTMLEEIINREYVKLRVLNSILTFSNEKIETEQFNNIWELIQEEENITMLGISDVSGKITNWKGEKLENARQIEHLEDILSAEREDSVGKCVLLEKSMGFEESELLYTVPLYIKEKFEGFLFKSKKISNVEDNLIEDIQFDGNASMFLVDTEGKILLVGEEEERFLLAHNLFTGCDDFSFDDRQKEELKKNLRDGKSGELIFRQNDKIQYAVYMPSGVGNWMIFSMVDKDAATLQYKKNDQLMERSVITILVLFVISLIVSIVLIVLYIRKKKQLQIEHFYQYHRYKQLMNELTFPVFRYNMQDDSITGNRKFQETYGRRRIENFMKNVNEWKVLHPEYNFDGLFIEMKNVIKYKKIITFESMWQSTSKNCWIKIILLPVRDEWDGEFLVFGTVMDTTQEHEVFDEVIEVMVSAQIGLYRFCLNESCCVEYINEGLQKILGYTADELNEILGHERRYTNLLAEQDREKYETFIRNIKDNGKTGTCEYSMICRDGSMMKLSDTLEVKNGSDGNKYGYGVVIDISKYRDAQKNVEKKLEKLKIQLNESRIKISTGQMQPHFLYNSLASIREIVLENPEYASDLIFDFTTHLRACIKSMASEEFTSFSQEIENIKAYVNIEKMRFGDKLQVKYDIQESDFAIVPLSIQPLVENAIRHGIYERGSIGGVVKISSYRDGDEIVIRVEDTGVGFDVDKIKWEVQSKERDSAGLQSLIFRFEKLMNAKVKVESIVGEGTEVTVKIPMKGEKNSESNYCR
ncbi:histidine kinase [Faecalimonas sp.]